LELRFRLSKKLRRDLVLEFRVGHYETLDPSSLLREWRK
jgi:hypothetical protein